MHTKQIEPASDVVGFSVSPSGTFYLIGIGDERWLRERMHAGCTELFTRPIQDGDLHEPAIERDLRMES